MKTRITARQHKISDQVKGYLEEKLERLDRYHDHIIDCEVIFGSEKQNECVEINLKVYSKTLHVKTKAGDVTKAIDEAIDKIEAQLKKFNGKIKAHPHVKVGELLAEEEEKE